MEKTTLKNLEKTNAQVSVLLSLLEIIKEDDPSILIITKIKSFKDALMNQADMLVKELIKESESNG